MIISSGCLRPSSDLAESNSVPGKSSVLNNCHSGGDSDHIFLGMITTSSISYCRQLSLCLWMCINLHIWVVKNGCLLGKKECISFAFSLVPAKLWNKLHDTWLGGLDLTHKNLVTAPQTTMNFSWRSIRERFFSSGNTFVLDYPVLDSFRCAWVAFHTRSGRNCHSKISW